MFQLHAARVAARWVSSMVVLAVFHAQSAKADAYTITDLGPGEALGINSSGAVVGVNAQRPFLWTSAAGQQDLGTLGEGWVWGTATGINDAGVVAGFFYHGWDQGPPSNTAFVWTPDQGLRNIGQPPGPFSGSIAADVDNLGRVTVLATAGSPQTSAAYRWREDSGWSYAGPGIPQATSSSGVIAVSIDQGPTGAIYWPDGMTTPVVGFPHAVNDYGEFVVVGSMGHYYLSSQSGLVDIGSADVSDLNNFGQAVGADLRGAFVWTAEAGIRRLDELLMGAPGWHLGAATAINDQGQIVGEGIIRGQHRAFRLSYDPNGTPDPPWNGDPYKSVPDTGKSVYLLAASVLLLSAMRKMALRRHAHGPTAPGSPVANFLLARGLDTSRRPKKFSCIVGYRNDGLQFKTAFFCGRS